MRIGAGDYPDATAMAKAVPAWTGAMMRMTALGT
jgi:hypothetical protein